MSNMIEFDGAVDVHRAAATIGLTLSGHSVAWPQEIARVAFAAEAPADIPARLTQARVERGAAQSLHILSAQGTWTVHARAVHVHRDVSAAFFAAIPAAPIGLRQRLFWDLVLTLAASALGRRLLQAWRRG